MSALARRIGWALRQMLAVLDKPPDVVPYLLELVDDVHECEPQDLCFLAKHMSAATWQQTPRRGSQVVLCALHCREKRLSVLAARQPVLLQRFEECTVRLFERWLDVVQNSHDHPGHRCDMAIATFLGRGKCGLAHLLYRRKEQPDEYGDDRNEDRKSTRLNSSHSPIPYAVFCLKKKNTTTAVHTPHGH